LGEYGVSLALTTIPENSGILDPVSKFVHVKNPLAGIALQHFKVGNNLGYPNVVPKRATSSRSDDSRKEQWIVNSHIDLAPWNDVYK